MRTSFTAVVGFTGFVPAPAAKGQPGPPESRRSSMIPRTTSAFPPGMTISPNRSPHVVRGPRRDPLRDSRAEEKSRRRPGPDARRRRPARPADRPAGRPPAAEADEDVPDLVIWHWQDKRLQSQQQVQSQLGPEFQLSRRISGQGQEIHPAGRRRRPAGPAPRPSSASPSGSTTRTMSSTAT